MQTHISSDTRLKSFSIAYITYFGIIAQISINNKEVSKSFLGITLNNTALIIWSSTLDRKESALCISPTAMESFVMYIMSIWKGHSLNKGGKK